MRLAIKATVIYFPLCFIYKLFAPEYSKEIHDTYYLWVNYFWFVTHLWNTVVFIDIKRHTIGGLHKFTAGITVFYGIIMLLLRGYLFFNIDQHYNIIDRAGNIGYGAVTILILMFFLTYKSWKKSKK
jgi:hypothetical protein